MKLRKTTAIYSFVIGAAMIATWVMLFALGQAEEPGIRFGFHLFSEFATAALMISAGILILGNKKTQRPVTYFGFGMLLAATAGAVVFYIVHLNVAILAMTAVAFVIALLLAILNYERVMDLIFGVLGVVIYGSLNIIGDTWQDMRWGPLTYISLAFVAGILLLVAKLVKKE
jgi:hypothetical protein